MLTCSGKDSLGIAVQLLLGVCSVDHGDNCEHHSLVTSGQVIQEFLGLLSLLLHIVRNNRREVVIAVLTTLPVGDVGLNTKQAVFNLSDCLVRGDRDNVDGEHHVSVQLGKF